MLTRGSLVVGLSIALLACGERGPATPDAAVGDGPPFSLCGNFVVEGVEQCDDGNTRPDDGCSPTCVVECGDGAVTGDETCDAAIAVGQPGACPVDADCTDADPCTTGVVSGAECQAVCDFSVTTAPIDGDGCCPVGADATSDNDCTAACGNGVVEGLELCDTAIANGAGACPTACDDGQDCTTDALGGAGTCAAACSATPITAIGPVDTCCPPGANPATDSDCSTTCGDGALSGDETCDTAIATGAGACPAACDDGLVCTTDTLVNAGTCHAACTTTALPPGPSDGCCPAGADRGDDPDCPAACGDGVISSPETCDDGNTSGGDGCSAICRVEPIGFRTSDLDLRDPHTFGSVPLFGCLDLTDFQLASINGVNPTLQLKVQGDGNGDGNLDLSLASTFNPLVQTAGSTSASDVVFPTCTAPMASTSCTLAAGASHASATATNQGSGAVCLGPVANTINTSYSPALVSPTAPNGGTCYVANAGTITFSLGGIPITLIDAHFGGEWFGTPATEIRDGMIRGFLTEATADATIIPAGTTGVASIDGHPVSSLLRGGTGSCNTPAPATGDKDTYQPPTGPPVTGWYFYLNFVAARVSYTEL